MPPPIVLVHSPLVGPATWDALAPAIRAHGHTVAIPDLTGTVADGPPYWSRQVGVIAASSAGERPILVAHSGAGPLLAAAGAALESASGYLFVDAGLPVPGRSWVESAPAELVAHLKGIAQDGWLPPWSEWWEPGVLAELLPDADVRARFAAGCPRLPMAMFEEARPSAPRWPEAPCAYLRLSEAYDEAAARARALGWPVIELASDHLGVLTAAGVVVDPLLDLALQLTE